jgi:hypothetical protein
VDGQNKRMWCAKLDNPHRDRFTDSRMTIGLSGNALHQLLGYIVSYLACPCPATPCIFVTIDIHSSDNMPSSRRFRPALCVLSSLKPIGYIVSYLACSIGHLDPS